MKNKLIKKAISEIKNPTFTITEELLEVLNVEKENGNLKVERVDLESFDETNVVYFPVENEPFFIAVSFLKEDNEIISVGTENGNQIYFTATSEDLTFEQLAEVTILSEITGWSLNDDWEFGNRKLKYDYSCLSFEPIKSNAYELETKLKLVLTELEKDLDGIRKLTKIANAIISIHHRQYMDGNKGINLDIDTINRLSKLNVGINIDQYVCGN